MGIADSDADLAFELEASLKESLGIAISDEPITAKFVSRLREKLGRNGLAEELPNRATRQRLYDSSAARGEEATQ